ncbi:MAG: hypothetical protein M3P37_11415, partial [Actinomycetota bacterium]|nr:hypothetical protein [Actinomycetota bacterium]
MLARRLWRHPLAQDLNRSAPTAEVRSLRPHPVTLGDMNTTNTTAPESLDETLAAVAAGTLSP